MNPDTGGVDNYTGGAGADTIFGIIDVGGGTPTSFSASDVINGSGGVDTLRLTLVDTDTGTTNNATPSIALVSDVEILNVSNATTALETTTISASNFTGLTKLIASQDDQRTTTITGLKTLVDVEQSGSGSLVVGHATAATIGTADSMKLVLSGTARGTNATNTFTTSNIETLVVTAAKDSAITIDGGTALTKTTVDGSAKLTIADSSNTTLKTTDASAATGAITVVSNGTFATPTIKTGSGDDTIDVRGVDLSANVTIDGGAGSDTLAVRNATFTETSFKNVTNVESIVLSGLGGNVTLDMKTATGLSAVEMRPQVASAVLTAAQTTIAALDALTAGVDQTADAAAIKAITGASGDAAYDNYATQLPLGTGAGLSNTYSFSTARGAARTGEVNALGGNDLTVTNLASGSTVTVSSKNLGALYATDAANYDMLDGGDIVLSVKDASKVANTADSVTLRVVNDNASTVKNTGATTATGNNSFILDSLTVATGEETVNIVSEGSFGRNVITKLVLTNATKLNISGATNLVLGSSDGNTVGEVNSYTLQPLGFDLITTDSLTFDASALTGTLSVTMSGADVNSLATGVKGGASASDSFTIALPSVDTITVAPSMSGFETVTAVFGPNMGFRVAGDGDTDAMAVDFSNVAASKYNASFYTNAQLAGSITMGSGTVLGVSGTIGSTGDLTITGAGTSAPLTLNFTDESSAAGAFVVDGLTLNRVGALTVDTTRVDGSDADTIATQRNTTFASVAGASLKSIVVNGVVDAAGGTQSVKLGAVNAGIASLVTTVDLSAFPGTIAAGGVVLSTFAGSKGATVSVSKTSLVGSVTGAGAGVTAASAGITLGAGADTVVLTDLKKDVVISNFDGAASAVIGSATDILDLKALGVTLNKLTFTDLDLAAGGAVDSVVIQVEGFDGRIVIVGTNASPETAATLAAANFLFS